MRVIHSTASTVHANLAWEERLLDTFEQDGPALFFCVNGPAVVMGKNQNPWRETHPALLAGEGVDLARRVSGGGTVYHDEGNLNYSLVLPRATYRSEDVLRRVIAVLLGFGLPAEILPANSLGVGGRKFSGHAFCYRGGAVLHHGTLLLDTDLDQLRQAMKPALPDLQTRAIASRPSPVVNLRELKSAMSLEQIRAALAREFAPGQRPVEAAPPESDPVWRELLERNTGEDWVLGYTPGFSWRITSGTSVLTLHMDRGAIQEALLSRGGVDQRYPGLAGCRFAREDILAALKAEMPGETGLWAEVAGHSF